jgi:cyanophycinase
MEEKLRKLPEVEAVFFSGAVYLVDAGAVTHCHIADASAEEALSISDLKLHVLISGEAFDLATRRPQQPTRRDSSES